MIGMLIGAIVLIILALSGVIFLLLLLNKAKAQLAETQENLQSALNDLEESDKTASEQEEKVTAMEEDMVAIKKREAKQLEQIANLKRALNADSFDGRFPICSHCKDIRDEGGSWHQIEEYISNLSESEFSHSLCPKCAKELYPDMFEDGRKMTTLTWK